MSTFSVMTAWNWPREAVNLFFSGQQYLDSSDAMEFRRRVVFFVPGNGKIGNGRQYCLLLFASDGRLQLLFFLDEPLDSSIEAVDFAGPSMAASRPSDFAARVYQIHIPDLGIEQAHGVSDVVGQSATDVARELDHEILVPSVLGDHCP